MASDPNLIRASDQDRDRVANVLREHHAVGRLDADEFSERLDKAFAAKTMGDLEALTADLPAVDPYPLPTSSMGHYASDSGLPATVIGAMSRGHGRFSPAWQAAWGSWLGTALLLIVIWALTGAGYPWPLWVIGPWGAVMAGRWLVGSHPDGHSRRGRIDPGQAGRLGPGQMGQPGPGQMNQGQPGERADDGSRGSG
ncbi:MAG TPA: DUF1707 domain-containing protein [Streptosporangiaceae bacterium]